MCVFDMINGEYRRMLGNVRDEYPELKLDANKTRGGHIKVKSLTTGDITFLSSTPKSAYGSAQEFRSWCKRIAKDWFRSETIESPSMPSHGYGSWH